MAKFTIGETVGVREYRNPDPSFHQRPKCIGIVRSEGHGHILVDVSSNIGRTHYKVEIIGYRRSYASDGYFTIMEDFLEKLAPLTETEETTVEHKEPSHV